MISLPDKPHICVYRRQSNMKFLVILATALICAQANQLQPQPNQLQPQPNQLQPQPNQLQPQPNQFQPQPNQLQPQTNQFQLLPNQFPFIFTTSLESPESPESPESLEDIRLILSQGANGLPGVGVVSQPILQAVKVKRPRPNKQQLIAQALQNYAAQRGQALTGQGLSAQQQPQTLTVQGLNLPQQQPQTLSVQSLNLPLSHQQPQQLTVQSLPLPGFHQPLVQDLSLEDLILHDWLSTQQQQAHRQNQPQPQSQPQPQTQPQLISEQGITPKDSLSTQQQQPQQQVAQPQPLSPSQPQTQPQETQLSSVQSSPIQFSLPIEPATSVQILNLPDLSLDPDQDLRDRRQTTSAPIENDKVDAEATTSSTTTTSMTEESIDITTKTTTEKPTPTIDPDTVRYTVEEEGEPAEMEEKVPSAERAPEAPITIQLLGAN